MNILQLQTRLRASGRYTGALDGIWGFQSQGALIKSLSDGPKTALTDANLESAAASLGVDYHAIAAVTQVESSGSGFSAGMPIILYEPHVFSRLTGHQFDVHSPDVSYPVWGTRPYPATQGARYAELYKAVGLNVDAAFSSCSYGRFQIMGESFQACGYQTSFDMAESMAVDEVAHLGAFISFVKSKNLVHALASLDWQTFARGYNGSGQVDAYAAKLVTAYHNSLASRL